MTLKDLQILRISLHSESTLSTQDWMVTLGKKLHLPTNFFNIHSNNSLVCTVISDCRFQFQQIRSLQSAYGDDIKFLYHSRLLNLLLLWQIKCSFSPYSSHLKKWDAWVVVETRYREKESETKKYRTTELIFSRDSWKDGGRGMGWDCNYVGTWESSQPETIYTRRR